MKSLCVFAAVALAASSPAFAANPQSGGTPDRAAAGKESAAEAGVVCRSVLQSGTRFKKKVCGRKAAWAKVEEEAKKASHEILGQGANTAPSQ